MMFWGDIIMQHPELIGEIPRDATALEWGYEHDHPYDADTKAFKKAGLPFYVCPGTGGVDLAHRPHGQRRREHHATRRRTAASTAPSGC